MKNLKKFFSFIFLLFIIFTFSNCSGGGSSSGGSSYTNYTNSDNIKKAQLTFMVYLDADNNLDPIGEEKIKEMEEVGSNENLNIIVLIDRSSGRDNLNFTDAKILYIEKGNTKVLQDLGEIDISDTDNLTYFINYAIKNYPANRYILSIFNHGGGYKEIGMLEDDTNNNIANIISISNSIKNSNLKKLDILILDACLMGQAEVIYEFKDCANYIIASENSIVESIPQLNITLGMPYNKILNYITNHINASNQDLSNNIVNKFKENYENADLSDIPQQAQYLLYYYTLASINTEYIPEFINYLKDFAQNLQNINNIQSIIGYCLNNTPFMYVPNTPLPDYIINYRDLGYFAYLIKNNLDIENENLKNSANNLYNFITTKLITNFVHGKNIKNTTGLTINVLSPYYYYLTNDSDWNKLYNYLSDYNNSFTRDIPEWKNFIIYHSDNFYPYIKQAYLDNNTNQIIIKGYGFGNFLQSTSDFQYYNTFGVFNYNTQSETIFIPKLNPLNWTSEEIHITDNNYTDVFINIANRLSNYIEINR